MRYTKFQKKIQEEVKRQSRNGLVVKPTEIHFKVSDEFIVVSGFITGITLKHLIQMCDEESAFYFVTSEGLKIYFM